MIETHWNGRLNVEATTGWLREVDNKMVYRFSWKRAGMEIDYGGDREKIPRVDEKVGDKEECKQTWNSPGSKKEIDSGGQIRRSKYKPGCIPPYVSLNSKSDLENSFKSEMKYLNDKEKSPYLTDIKYFFMAIYNILFKGVRSS